MRLPLLIIIITIAINLAIDWYIYHVIKKTARHPRVFSRIHIGIVVALFLYIIIGISLPRRSGSDASLLNIMWIIYSYFTIYLPKWIYIIFDLVASIPRLWKRAKLKIVSFSGIALAFTWFILMWWGALFNRYNISINNVDIEISSLPDEFDGYRIAQFSDLHAGSYKNDTTFLAQVVDAINAQKPDMIAFTGDIVNRRTDEIIPFLPTLSRLKAPDGVYSILGNHDYGDYCNWENDAQKRENLVALHKAQESIGWKLLLNETSIIRHGNDSIAIIGVENWGDPPFSVYGDLTQSYPTLNDSITKILLTHNPAHWTSEIANNDKANISLTLSGHTHAMQMSLFGLSPSVWRYKTWGGLYYDKSGKYLYVNIGIGTVGIPTRIGATPEITILTLHKAQ